MTPLSKQILQQYQVRKTNGQKLDFIALLQKQFPEMTVEESNFPKCRNLIIGDLDRAKVILTAHYDTCPRSLLPSFVMPKKPVLSIFYRILTWLPALLGAIALIYLLTPLGFGFWVNYGISVAAYTLLILYFMFLSANPHNANDNTSGVITLCELLGMLNQQSKEKLAFVFFDLEEAGLIGSSQFRSKHQQQLKDKILINFDCVGDGDYFLISATKDAQAQYGEILKNIFQPTKDHSLLFTHAKKTYYPSDQAGFQNAVVISALKHKKGLGYYLNRIHSPLDTQCDPKNISYLSKAILQLTKKL